MTIKTINQVIRQSNIPAKLVRNTVKQLGGTDSLEDVANHGADSGFCGFAYYKDTFSFWRSNRHDILALVESRASDLGEEPLAMVANFNCLKPSDNETKASIAKCLYGGKTSFGKDSQVANALAWFALEEVARAFSND